MEFLLRIRDDDHRKAGTVVVVCPDGWGWGRAEVDSKIFRVVKCYGMPAGALDDIAQGRDRHKLTYKHGLRFADEKRLLKFVPDDGRQKYLLDLRAEPLASKLHSGVIELTQAEQAQMLAARKAI